MFLKRFIIICGLLCLAQPLLAQITPKEEQEGGYNQNDPFNSGNILQQQEESDTTNNRRKGRILGGEKEPKSPYGPSTTRFFSEAEFFRGDSTVHLIDTTLAGLHRYEIIEQLDQKYQHLGANGTALNPIFPVLPTTIGRTPGFSVYDLYALPPDSVKYFDTKSPYTKMHLVFGGNNRNIVDIAYARNVTPRWNISAHMYRVITDKQLGASARRDDRNAVSNRYGFNTSYRSENDKYALLASFVRLKHDVEEIGGIVPPTTGAISDYYDTDNVSIELGGAEATDLRQQYHLYHQYKLSPILQVYHKLDRQNQLNKYRDPLSDSDFDYYSAVLIRTDTTTDRFKFREFTNEVGIKGRLEDALFYAFYYKRRDINFLNPYVQADPFNTEHYIGGHLRTDLNERTYLSARAEYLEGGNYMAEATVFSPWAEVGFTRMLRKPAYMEERFFGNHYEWSQDFTTETTDQLKGNIILHFGERLTIRPGAVITQVTDPVFFNQEQQSEQRTGAARIYSPELELNAKLLRNVYLDAELIHTFKEGEVADVFRIPEWFANSRVYYHGNLFNDVMEARIGLDMHFRTSYLADAYAPGMQQFYLQDAFRLPQAFVADFFFDFKIKRAMLFFKMTQVNQGIPYEGYFTTPGYTGVGRQIDLGINWQFYD